MKNIRNYIEEQFLKKSIPLNEIFIDANLAKSDEELLRLAIIAELDAVNLYKQFAEKTKNPVIKKVMLDIAEEENVHIFEFMKILKHISPETINSEEEADGEIEDLIGI